MIGITSLVLVKKPVAGLLFENCFVSGNGMLNIKACENQSGRFPCNVILQDIESVNQLIPQSKAAYRDPEKASATIKRKKACIGRGKTGFSDTKPCSSLYCDSGSNTRFFFNYGEQPLD